MEKLIFIIIVCLLGSVLCKPLDLDDVVSQSPDHPHSLQKRFINPLFTVGSSGVIGVSKIRAKRSEDECEKLALCKLHARSSLSFFAAYQLYFVNKENARLWDHRARSAADCEQRFGDCYEK